MRGAYGTVRRMMIVYKSAALKHDRNIHGLFIDIVSSLGNY